MNGRSLWGKRELRAGLTGLTRAAMTPVQAGRGAFQGIDALRGLAALSVVLFHYKNFIYTAPGPTTVTMEQVRALPLFRALAPVIEHGAAAVMLFWLISGFVFMHVYAGRRDKAGLRTFAVHRFARLYPLHLLTFLVVALMQAWAMEAHGRYWIYPNQDLKHFVLQIFMASNWGFEDGLSYNGPIWSVSVEILIYAAFFVFIRTLAPRPVAIGFVFCAFVAFFLKFHSLVALCGVYFFWGGGIYALYRGFAAARPWRGLLSALLMMAAGLVAPGPETFAMLLLFGGMVLGLTCIEDLTKGRIFNRFHWLGDISYSVYLVHTPLIIAFLSLVAAGIVPLELVIEPAFPIAYLVIVCLLGRVAFVFVERPAQTWLRRRLLPDERA